MKTIAKTIAMLLLGAATPALSAEQDVLPVTTDEITQYRNVGDWDVHQNLTRGHCFISRTDDAGHLVQFGLTKDADYGYIGIFQKGAKLKEGSQDVGILLGNTLYVGESRAVVNGSDEYEGGYVLTNNEDLVRGLDKEKEMVVFPDKPFMLMVNLDDVRNAIYEARECTKKLQGS